MISPPQFGHEIGAISVLVNNAGIIRRGTGDGQRARGEDWDATLAVNLDGPYNMVTAFLDQLRETKGSIINIGSIQSFVALPNSAAYTTSKGGVRLLTKALAIELSPLGIRVNAIGPGFTATPLNATRAKTRTTWPISKAASRWAASARPRTSRARRLSRLRHGPLHHRRHPARRRRLSRALTFSGELRC